MNTTIWIIGGLLVVVAVLVTVMRRIKKNTDGTENEIKICETTGELCCGGGENCHRFKDQAKVNPIQYFEDEELDRFRGKPADGYTADEVEEWREVMTTLRPAEVRSWVTSIHRRELHIPSELAPAIQRLMSENPQK